MQGSIWHWGSKGPPTLQRSLHRWRASHTNLLISRSCLLGNTQILKPCSEILRFGSRAQLLRLLQGQGGCVGRGEGTAGEKAYVVHSQGGLVGSTLFLADVRNQVLFTCCLACSCCWQQEECTGAGEVGQGCICQSGKVQRRGFCQLQAMSGEWVRLSMLGCWYDPGALGCMKERKAGG